METITTAVIDSFRPLDRCLFALTAPLRSRLKWKSVSASATLPPSLNAIKSPFTSSLPLMDPLNVFAVVCMYLAVVAFGTRIWPLLSNHKFTLKYYALAHNFVLTTLSLYMFLEVLHQAARGKYKVFGNNLEDEKTGRGMAKIICVFYLSKILEFNDTLIMILKRNFHQVSFLHVYHHTSIFTIWWLVTLWAPSGESYFSAMLNSFIHVIMYGYYFLSALGFKQVAAVKKYITSAQMTQFVCMMIQATYNIVIAFMRHEPVTEQSHVGQTKPQRYPLALSILLWWYMVSMLILFAGFYRRDRQREASHRRISLNEKGVQDSKTGNKKKRE